MKKRVLSLALALCMAILVLPLPAARAAGGVWDGSVAETFGGGDGLTADTAYWIGTGDQLALLAALVNGTYAGSTYTLGSQAGVYFKLTGDINLNDVADFANWGTVPPANNWTPIGSVGNAFSGTLDGDGNTISGLYVDSAARDAGLVGFLSGGTVKNLNVAYGYVEGGDDDGTYVSGGIVSTMNSGSQVINCQYDGVVEGRTGAAAGGIVGWGLNSVITDCRSTARVDATAGASLGGIAGMMDQSDILRCSNAGRVGATNNSHAGGIAGAYSDGNSIVNCYNTGDVGNNSAGFTGGIIGEATVDTIVENCYNTGSIAGSRTGGIAGDQMGTPGSTVIMNCYSTGSVGGFYRGGIAGGMVDAAIRNSYWLAGTAPQAGMQFYGTNVVQGCGSFSGSGTSWALGLAEHTITDSAGGEATVGASSSLLDALNAYVADTSLYTWEAGETTPVFGPAWAPLTLYTSTVALNLNGAAAAGYDVYLDTESGVMSGWDYTLTDNGGGSYSADVPDGAYYLYLYSGSTRLYASASAAITISGSGDSETVALYSITKTAAPNGTYTVQAGGADVTQAATGATVTLAATPAEGYAFASWSVYKTGDPTTTVTVSGNSFTMPPYAVIIEATFTANSYAVTMAAASHGTFTVRVADTDVTEAATNATVTLAATPAGGYRHTGWNVYRTGAPATTVSISGSTFTMPPYAVTVEAVFAANVTPDEPWQRTITVVETDGDLFRGSRAAKASADMANAFTSSVEVRITDTQVSAASFGVASGNEVYPFDISLYVKGTFLKVRPNTGYAVTISLPVPDALLEDMEQLVILHRADDGSVTRLQSRLAQINGAWYLVFEANRFSPYALMVDRNIPTLPQTGGSGSGWYLLCAALALGGALALAAAAWLARKKR